MVQPVLDLDWAFSNQGHDSNIEQPETKNLSYAHTQVVLIAIEILSSEVASDHWEKWFDLI